jgi:hypothetical protein
MIETPADILSHHADADAVDSFIAYRKKHKRAALTERGAAQLAKTLRDLKHGCPDDCPTGLFGNDISELCGVENHRHENWGKNGMVYWSHRRLKRLAGVP